MQTAVPFEKLTAPSEINARDPKDAAYKDVADLVSSIKAVGLLQPLVVRQNGAAYEVLAGKRRFTAIASLRKSGHWPHGQNVPVIVKDLDDERALEASFIENTARRAMHPVQEYEVFAKLCATGDDHHAIAERYGITAQHVRQRLALGHLHPSILKAWRAGEINQEAAQAFAAVKDRKTQGTLFKEISAQGSVAAAHVRARASKGKVRIDDPRVKLVGVDAYKTAGGTLRESLFGNDGVLDNEVLLDELVEAAIAARCSDLVQQGWSWAVPASTLKNIWSYPREYSTNKAFTPDEKTRLAEIERVLAKIPEDDYDAGTDLETERQFIENEATGRGFSKAKKAVLGCAVGIGNDGLEITYGLRRDDPAAAKKKGARSDTADATPNAAGDEPDSTGVSAALLLDITVLQTDAVAKALEDCPALAVRLLAVALSPSNKLYRSDGMSPIRINPEGLRRYESRTSSDDDADADDAGDRYDDYDPEANEFADRLAEIDDKSAPKFIAAAMRRVLDLRRQKFGSVDAGSAAALVAAIPGDLYLKTMRAQFGPLDYFSRAPIPIIKAALDEMGAAYNDKAKKGDLAEVAATEATAKGWLPAELRHPAYKLQKRK